MEEKENIREIDFTAVPVEEEIDAFIEVDYSKSIGNYIHKMAEDIGMDDLAREIYHKGKAGMTDEQAEQVTAMIRQTNLPPYIRTAIINHINKQ